MAMGPGWASPVFLLNAWFFISQYRTSIEATQLRPFVYFLFSGFVVHISFFLIFSFHLRLFAPGPRPVAILAVRFKYLMLMAKSLITQAALIGSIGRGGRTFY